MRRGRGFAALLWLSLAGLGACARGAEPLAPITHARHALLISIDTLRPDHLSCYGHSRLTSPTLDELAARGARFTDVTAAAPWTLPSHATMLTGLYASHHGVKDHETRLPAEVQTLAEDFRDEGFETFAVVNTHNVGAPQFRLAQGFQRFEYIVETDKDQRTGKLRTLNTGEVVVSTAKEMLARRDPAKPFFMFLHFYDVHTDWTPDEESRALFVRPYGGKFDGRTQPLNRVRNRGEPLSDEDLVFLRDLYDAEIRTFDALLGRFLRWLDEQGLLDDTLLCVTSDHGEEFKEHGSVLHGRTQYQEVLRVPLILAGPGVPARSVFDDAVHGVDVAPTLLGLMGVASDAASDGLDLSRLWRGGTLPQRLLFAEADHNNVVDGKLVLDIKRMVRRGNDKLIHDRAARRVELYDLGLDPAERADVSAARGALALELEAELKRFLAGAIEPEAVPAPTREEQLRLDAMGYGGAGEEEE